MIELVQPGQSGKTSLLFDMHRLRARVFKDTLKWDVSVNDDGLEVDQFDTLDALYLLALNVDGRVVGSWRMLPTTGPTMIRDVWPQFLPSLPMPSDPDVWEVSRFAIHSPAADPAQAEKETRIALGEMFCALTEVCIMSGIREIFTLYDQRIAQVIARINCHPYISSKDMDINGMTCRTGAFRTDEEMLEKLRAATGITQNLLTRHDLPPLLSLRTAPPRKEGSRA